MFAWLGRLVRPTIRDDKADPATLARIGAEVAERLRAQPGVRALGGSKAELFTLEHFLPIEECTALIAAIEGNVRPSPLFSGTGQAPSPMRTSSTHYFAGDAAATRHLGARLDALTGIPRSRAETIQGQRYRPGEQYRHHCDFFRLEREHWQLERRRGGQRSWSAMIYLNEVEAGGETDFPELGLRVAPVPGMLIAWNNMDRQGHPNRATRHAGLPVSAGAKYVVTQWYRQEDWVRSPGSAAAG